jgi:hypothetical protein
MEKKEIIIYSHLTNIPVIQTPDRKFPGSIIQGDTLNSYFRISKEIYELLKKKDYQNPDLIDLAEDLHRSLYDRLYHYQEVLQKEEIELPYYPELKSTDFIAEPFELDNDIEKKIE